MIKKYSSKVLSIDKFSKNLIEITIEKPDGLSFIPGQYISVQIGEKKKLLRPYSIASTNSENSIKIFLKNVGGPGSKYLFSLKTGQKIEYLASLGDFHVVDKNHDLIFISTGTGIAPFRSMIGEIIDENFDKKIILISGFKNKDQTAYHNYFEKLESENKNFEYYEILSKPKSKAERVGHIQDHLEIVPKDFNGDFYICGLNDMIKDVSKKLQIKGIEKKRIFYEMYD